MELKLYQECLKPESYGKHIHTLTIEDFKYEVQGIIICVWQAGGRCIYWNNCGSYEAIVNRRK
jgi:hypothetical protein